MKPVSTTGAGGGPGGAGCWRWRNRRCHVFPGRAAPGPAAETDGPRYPWSPSPTSSSQNGPTFAPPDPPSPKKNFVASVLVFCAAVVVCVSRGDVASGEVNSFSSAWPAVAEKVKNPSTRYQAFSGMALVSVRIVPPDALSTRSVPLVFR